MSDCFFELLRLSRLALFLRPIAFKVLLLAYAHDWEALFRDSPGDWQKQVPFSARERRLLDQFDLSQETLEKEGDWLERHAVRLVSIQDERYPALLKETADPPYVLFCRGQIEQLGQLAKLAVVGSREMNGYGQGVVEKVLGDFSGPLAIVSGMAMGVDGHAHRVALHRGMPTIGVLGSGIDGTYPKGNRDLYREMCENGLLISEFPLFTPAMDRNFPRRNRIIAGLCQGLLVIQARLRSGTLISARLANEAGREVFAVPGPIDSALHEGCHWLISQGAKLLSRGQDIVDELPEFSPYLHSQKSSNPDFMKDIQSSTPLVKELYSHFLQKEKWQIDALAETVKRPPRELFPALLDLQMKGYLSVLPGQWYVRK